MIGGFEHVEQSIVVPTLRSGRETQRHRVLIAGGGPVGLALGLALAKQGIPSLIVEADTTVCVGSRAICLSRRTLEILDKLGALDAFAHKGLPWTGGRSFHRDELVFRLEMPHDADQRLAPMTNLQQYYIEQFLFDATRRWPDMIEVRWGTSVGAILPTSDGVEVELHASGLDYRVEADFVVACDGARSQIRQGLGLKMEGTAYEAKYIIVDIELDVPLPTERLAWFDPPSNPGRTMLMHKQPDNIWRLDYQLRADEDADEMLLESNIVPVVEAHLRMMHIDRPWRLVWASMYRAAALSLAAYRKGRVLFAGDAAHLVPIFGVRGLNSGFEDVFNLGWKLAEVLKGSAPETLLDSYSQERQRAWQVNVASAMKSTEFMAPPSRGYELMRDAVLSLAKSHPSLATLINPRQSSATSYDDSPLNIRTGDEAGFRAGPAPGQPVPECPMLVEGGGDTFLTRQLPATFVVLAFFPKGEVPYGFAESCDEAARNHPSLSVVVVKPAPSSAPSPGPADVELVDAAGRFRALFDADPGAIYLIRPDGHVCARWRSIGKRDLADALATALTGRPKVPFES
jgi:3-(3-hydroxy-phenyl)propionate hydroxylase